MRGGRERGRGRGWELVQTYLQSNGLDSILMSRVRSREILIDHRTGPTGETERKRKREREREREGEGAEGARRVC
jgi:hypothetical protein